MPGPQDPRAPSFRSMSRERVGEHNSQPAPIDCIAAFVPACGQSHRMGHGKALVPLAGQRLIAQALSPPRVAPHFPSQIA
jgi:hypothetical protein